MKTKTYDVKRNMYSTLKQGLKNYGLAALVAGSLVLGSCERNGTIHYKEYKKDIEYRDDENYGKGLGLYLAIFVAGMAALIGLSKKKNEN